VEPTEDPARAARRLMTDDGFNIGVLFKGNRPAFSAAAAQPTHAVSDLEAGFSL
jgi:2-oxoglutarate ferredoxin oxidoreductase subunit beta